MTPDQIKQDLEWLDARINYLEEEYVLRTSILQGRIEEIQNLCEHTNKTYYPDPSGNGDSHYECNICGKTAKKL